MLIHKEEKSMADMAQIARAVEGGRRKVVDLSLIHI